MRSFRSTLVVLALAVCPMRRANAQQPATRAAADSFAYAMEIESGARWMHARQQSRFSPFTSERALVVIDSVRVTAKHRTLYLELGYTQYGRDSATIVVDSTGRAEARLRRAQYSRTTPYAGAAAEFAKRRLEQTGIAEQRLWDLIPALPRGVPRGGLMWTDTIARSVSDGPFRRALRGIRVSSIMRDTTVSGRRLWIVRDSANVRYEEAYLEQERTLDTTVLISRSAAGTIRGVHLLDVELSLFRWRADTARLRGDATLRYPDGRSFTTPARYDRVREWKLYEPREYAAHSAEQRATNARRFGGMVNVPSDALEERLSKGDVGLRDSLLREWKRATDPDEANQIFSSLRRWLRDDASQEMLARARMAAGDTAFLYEYLSNRAYDPEKPADTADIRAMLRFMQDPAIAWGFNLSRDWLYENLVQGMTTWPRAARVASDDHVACTLAACRLLAAQWRNAREPRLGDVGLVALFSMDPRRWADTVLALDLRSHPLLRSAKMLAIGTAATWASSSKTPMPAPNSDARVWREWMSGGGRALRFEESHRTAIRVYTVRTGRDIAGELRQGYRQATTDSARLVFGMMLQRLNQLRLSEAQLVEAFTSGVPARAELARTDLAVQLGQARAPLSAEKSAPFIDKLIAAVVSAGPLWRGLNAPFPRGRRAALPELHDGRGPIFFESDNVPASVRAAWAGRAQFMSKLEWSRREPREAGTFYSLQPIMGFGRFARVDVTLSERIARPAGSVPEAYAAGSTIYLMELDGEWVMIASEGWVT